MKKQTETDEALLMFLFWWKVDILEEGLAGCSGKAVQGLQSFLTVPLFFSCAAWKVLFSLQASL